MGFKNIGHLNTAIMIYSEALYIGYMETKLYELSFFLYCAITCLAFIISVSV
jgi:hypothetical protein